MMRIREVLDEIRRMSVAEIFHEIVMPATIAAIVTVIANFAVSAIAHSR